MRLFCGLALAYQVRRNVELLLQHLKPLAPISWTHPDNLHITTKFIGEWPSENLSRLVETLKAIPAMGEMEVAIRGLGWFPNPHQPRLLLAGVAASLQLEELHKATDQALGAIGVAIEKRPYHPHVTLARVKANADVAAVRQAIAGLPSTDFGRFNVAKNLLYLSEPSASGSVYRVIAEIPLVASGSPA